MAVGDCERDSGRGTAKSGSGQGVGGRGWGGGASGGFEEQGNGGKTAEGGQRSSGSGGALLSSAACSARARKGNGEAKSDLAIAMAVESLSGAGSCRHGEAQ